MRAIAAASGLARFTKIPACRPRQRKYQRMSVVNLPVRWRHFSLQHALHWTLLGAVVIVVFYPVVLVVVGSFQTAGPSEEASYSLDAWRFAFSDPALLTSVWNTIALSFVRQSLALAVGIPLAWVLARCDIPGSHWLEFMFWIAFFLPTLPLVLAWIMLLDPQYGLLNQLIAALPFVGKRPFNIYSFWGIVWAHLVTNSIAIKVMLLTPAFRNMDASLEEASNVSGANNFWTLVRIVLPVMAPAVTVVVLLAIIHSMQAFEIELILGVPIRYFVFSTQIYNLVRQAPLNFPAATALSTMILALVVPLIVLQRWITVRRSYQTVGGQYKGQKIRLRRWRLPVFFLVLGVALLTTVVPFVFLIVGTFMKLFGFFNTAELWTGMHWRSVIHDSRFVNSISNTIVLAAGTALASMVICTLIAYVVVRTRFVARAVLDFVSWLPITLPGIILGVGLLSLFLRTPGLQPLYGTIFIMIIATIIATMTNAVQITKSNFVQLGNDVEEAARVHGGSWPQAFRHVMLPLMTPTLLLVGTLGFISAARNVSTVVLLGTSSTTPLSLLQLDFMVEGRYESAAVVGVIIVAITTGIAFVARLIGLRAGLHQS
jgi:iron(III) transport system permease protein